MKQIHIEIFNYKNVTVIPIIYGCRNFTNYKFSNIFWKTVVRLILLQAPDVKLFSKHYSRALYSRDICITFGIILQNTSGMLILSESHQKQMTVTGDTTGSPAGNYMFKVNETFWYSVKMENQKFLISSGEMKRWTDVYMWDKAFKSGIS